MINYLFHIISIQQNQENGDYANLDSMTQVINKAERVLMKLEDGFPWDDQIFNPAAWMKVLGQLTSPPTGRR